MAQKIVFTITRHREEMERKLWKRIRLMFSLMRMEIKTEILIVWMFPASVRNGLHVGHWRGYVISDVWSRV